MSIALRFAGTLRCILAGTLVLMLSARSEGIPDKIVVLTFDDSIKSHYSVVAPLLKQYGFGATFFVTEGFEFKTDKDNYMTWEEIASLHRDGFEIGNHTRDHMGVSEKSLGQLTEQVEAINARCREYGIPRPTSFAYPGNAIADAALEKLKELGFVFARRGGTPEYPYEEGRGFAYEPGLDHPLLIPSAGDARPHWELNNFTRAAEQAKFGRIAVLQFHGVPDRAHAWVHTPRKKFEAYLKWLDENEYTVIALRDLVKYVNPDIGPNNPQEVIEDRKHSVAQGTARQNFRPLSGGTEQSYWLRNMIVDHQFDRWEVRAATGLPLSTIERAMKRSSNSLRKSTKDSGGIKIRPYPGGRHPRIGFLDGAMRPQRETKFSVFAPWSNGGYAVVDVPEAIWNGSGQTRELLYLAHTHVPTMWDRQEIRLEPLEWTRKGETGLTVRRELPNKVTFGAKVQLDESLVRMELWIKNGAREILTGLNVQNCVMLKELRGFTLQDNRNKVFRKPYAASHDESGRRWIITAWNMCERPWANPNCPCLHADPRFPDCPPGEERRIRGIVSFYEGENIQAELDRLDSVW